MKLFKKMVALVAVAACCFTMTAPVKAEAASPVGCEHENLRLSQKRTPHGSAYSRNIAYAVDYDRDGNVEYIEDVCSEQTWLVYDVTVCNNCSAVYSMVLTYSYVQHSEPLYCPGK